MRRYLIIALGLVCLGATFTPVSPASARPAYCSKSCYCPFSKTGCQRLCQARYEGCLRIRRGP